MRRLFTIFSIVLASNSFVVSEASARVDVKSVSTPKPLYELKLKYMYAIGEEAKTGDLVTVANGRVYVSKVQPDGTIKIADSMQTVAAKLLLTHVKHWTEVPLEGKALSGSTLGPFMDTVLKKTGYELAGVFPFLIKGTFDEITVQGVSRKKAAGLLVGFLTRTMPADHSASKFDLAMHFIDDNGKYFGSVSDLVPKAGSKTSLFMPE